MTKSLKELLEEEENRQLQTSTAAVNSLVQQSNKAEMDRIETPVITGVVLPESVRAKVSQYKKDQAEYDNITGGQSTVDDFLKFYNKSGYEELAIDYAYGNDMTVDEFHNAPTDQNYWKNLHREKDKETLAETNASIIGNDIDTKFNFSANGIKPKLTKIPELHKRNMLGFTAKTLAKGTGSASMYNKDDTAYRLIVENDIRSRLPEEIAANFSVIPIEQATMETLGVGGEFDKNFAIVNKLTGEYELLNKAGMTDNVTSFVAGMATPELAANVAGDVAVFAATKNTAVRGLGLAVTAGFGYSVLGKDLYSNPRRLEGTGYYDPDPIKEGDAIVMGVLSPLLGMWSFGARGVSNKARTALNMNTSDELKSAIKYLDDSGIDPAEVLTAGNFAAFLNTLQNQSKNLAGKTGAVSKKETERNEIFTEFFSRLIGANSSSLDDILKVVDGDMLRDVYTAADSLILSTTEKKLGVKTGGNKNVDVGQNLLDIFRMTQGTYKNIKGTMYDEAEDGINQLIRRAENSDYKVFYQIPDNLQKQIEDILTGLKVPQASSQTIARDVEASVTSGATQGGGTTVPIAEGQFFRRRSNISKEESVPTDAKILETTSGNLPPINFSNIPANIAAKFKSILGYEIDDAGNTIMKGAGVSVVDDKPMIRGIFGAEGNTAFDTLRGLEKQITKELHLMQDQALTNGSSTAVYKTNAQDLIKLRSLVHDIMDIDNLKRTKTNEGGSLNVAQFEGNVFPIGQSNEASYQTIKNALDEVKAFTSYQEKVFDTTNFKQLATDSFLNELPAKIIQREIGDVSTLDNYINTLFTQVDTISSETLKDYFPDGVIPKNIQKMIDAGTAKRTAIKQDFKESFTASLLEMSDDQLTKFLNSANKNKAILKTMFGDEYQSAYTNLKLYNTSMMELAERSKLVYAPEKKIQNHIKDVLNNSPKELKKFIDDYAITGQPKEQLASVYLNNLMMKAFTNKGKDGTFILDMRVAVAEMDGIITEYFKKQGSPLKDIFDDTTIKNLGNFRQMLDIIAVQGGDMGSSLVTSTIAANSGKISQPNVMARAFWNIYKYGKIGEILTGQSVVKRLLKDVKPQSNKITAGNLAASEATSTIWQITQNAAEGYSSADYEELLNLINNIPEDVNLLGENFEEYRYGR